jgi:hypothetical protein
VFDLLRSTTCSKNRNNDYEKQEKCYENRTLTPSGGLDMQGVGGSSPLILTKDYPFTKVGGFFACSKAEVTAMTQVVTCRGLVLYILGGFLP